MLIHIRHIFVCVLSCNFTQIITIPMQGTSTSASLHYKCCEQDIIDKLLISHCQAPPLFHMQQLLSLGTMWQASRSTSSEVGMHQQF